MIKDIEPFIDKVYISRQDVKKIVKYYKTNPVLSDEFDRRLFFPLDKFILEIEDSRVKGLIELDNFSPCHWRYTSDCEDLRCDREGKGFKADYHVYGIGDKSLARKSGSDLEHIIIQVMFYIILSAEQRRREYRISPNLDRKESENYKYRERECFLMSDIVEYTRLHPTKKSLKYRCECWGVRGHIRHTKSGVQFVHPYKKGKKRDILEPKNKTYLIGGSDDRSGNLPQIEGEI